MNNPITFTIAIPAYKADYLQKCIESIIHQTYRQWEMIILDDESPEPLLELVKPYLNDDRIHYIRNPKNVGACHVVSNWNKCLALAQGDYFLCMGDDDMLPHDSLKVYADTIAQHPQCHAIHGWTRVIDEHGIPKDIQTRKPAEQSVYEVLLDLFRGDRQFVGDWLYKTTALRDAGGYVDKPYAWTSDHLTALLLGQPHGVANTQQTAFLYRENNKSITSDSSITTEKVKVICTYHKWLEDFLSQDATNESDYCIRDILRRELSAYIGKLKAYLIGCDIAKNFTAIFYWTLHRNVYQLTTSYLLRSFLLGLKMKK